ncbi:hypothetical protein PV10_00418 [Exophiala mesophila]|uniref:Pyruvate decarboxylase n=1 Tax=Exophiala mesophila TaxID=212818 RepID=A0A0D1X481_EXOME|nr:uncharacterized protein PV10_00418 [Exophiala mesophila]KIV96570.1 hypothetical protein PV10_00418 [Exophiala mesophila]
MGGTLPLAEYLLARLKQLNIGAIHGVPGDYNLTLLDYVEPAGLLWVGSVNELNAGYATDGYARIKGMGALITTFGVGELSAINAIAGAFAERAAVVHIVGVPPRHMTATRANIHHTLGDGDYDHFRSMAAHVTVAQANLSDPRTVPQQIDATLLQCLIHSRPVYIQVPVDVVSVHVDATALSNPLVVPDMIFGTGQRRGVQEIADRIHSAKRPVILIDGETAGLGITDLVAQLVNVTQWPTFTLGTSNGLVDATLPHVYGIYHGAYASQRHQDMMAEADLVLHFGPHLSSTNTSGFTAIPERSKTISFTHGEVQVGDKEIHRDLPARVALSELLHGLEDKKLAGIATKEETNDGVEEAVAAERPDLSSFRDVSLNDAIRQKELWRLLATFLRPGDIVMAETGTAAYGARHMSLPKNARLLVPMTWLSIGYMLPASQGVALAQRELSKTKPTSTESDSGRTILVIGDGSFQLTVQELATISHHRLNVVIIVLNNQGYTIERCIHNKEASYNDITAWRNLLAPRFFGAEEDVYTASARTYQDLERVLRDEQLSHGQTLRMVEVFLDRFDAPSGPLQDMINKQA